MFAALPLLSSGPRILRASLRPLAALILLSLPGVSLNAQANAAQIDSGAAVAPYAAHPSRMLGTPVIRPVAEDRDGSKAEPDDLQAAIKAALALPPDTVSIAPFVGNFTVIQASSANGLLLARQADCSLTAVNMPYSGDLSNAYGAATSQTTHYDQSLHTQAKLTTAAGRFPGGCADPKLGVVSSSLLYAGRSTGGMRMGVIAGYNSASQRNVLFTVVTKSDGTYVSTAVRPLPSPNGPYGVVAGDVNGDGNPDVVAVGYEFVNGSSAGAATVLLGKADGTFTVGATYPLGAGVTGSVVMDDFNGDGKLDFVVPVNGKAAKFGNAATTLAFYPGNGDGTFGTPKTMNLPGGADSFAAGDVNGDGKKDLVSGLGAVLLGNGDGTFQLLPTVAFPVLATNSSASPQVALGDFNGDGKLDIAAGTGAAIYLYLGNGDGTFSVGNVYAGIDNQGHLTATDLDGDGFLDLYSGSAGGGVFGGDGFSASEGYALMGLGNGSFAGAPVLNYASFNTMQDLNGDGKPDFIGLSGNALLVSQPTFATYLGRGDGTFQQAGASLAAKSFTYSGTTYSIFNVNSYVTGDLNGDGRPDLLYLPGDYSSTSPRRAGFVTAFANADGSFQAPAFFPAPSFDSGQEGTPQLANLKSATNQNGRLVIVYGYQESTYIASPNSVRYTTGYATQVSNGDGTFSAPALTVTYTGTYIPGMNGNQSTALPNTVLAYADLNGDKTPDLVTFVPKVYASGGVVVSPAFLQVMLGKADGTFAAATTVPVVEDPVDSSFTLGDLNGDGIPDIAAEGRTTSGTTTTSLIGIGLGKGDGTFNVLTPLQGGSTLDALSIGDYTGDGKADLAMVSFTGQQGIFPGNGDGTLQATPRSSGSSLVVPPLGILLYSSAGSGTPAAGYDVNGDGKLDLIAGGTVLLQSAVPGTLVGTATTLTAAPLISTRGSNVTLSATVTVTSGSATPAGTVTFSEGSTSLGTTTLDSNGKASFSTGALALGSHTLLASYSGSTTLASSISSPVTVTVVVPAPGSASASLSASAAAAVAGSGVTFTVKVSGPAGTSLVPGGTVTFLAGSASLGTAMLDGTGTAQLSTTQLSPGANSVTAQYAGDTNFAAATSNVVTVTITVPVAASTTTLSASPIAINSGQSVALTARVAGPSGNGNVPTGTVTFLAGTTTLGTGTLSSGTATLSTAALPAGAIAITASYGGDANFAASVSSPVTVTVTGVNADFSVSLSPVSATVTAGGTAATTISVQPAGGFSQAITFTCSGLPANSRCTFSPASVTPSGSTAVTAQLSIATNTASAALGGWPFPWRTNQTLVTCALAGLLGLAGVRRRCLPGLLVVAAACCLAATVGCGHHGLVTPTGSSTVTVTATAGATSHTATFALTVQ